MKLSELLTKLLGMEATKALAETAKAELGDLPDMDLKEYGARIKKADADAVQLSDLSKTVKELDGKVKEVEPLKTKVAGYEKTLSDGLLETTFRTKALAAGVKKEAIDAALKLANLSGAKVDLEKKEVTGVTQEVFDGLKTQHSFLFGPAATAKEPIPATPALGATQSISAPQAPAGSYMSHFMKAAELQATEKN